jgi:4-amino-4-deoxy-L-arabinose transferase-like glycosyltransferase
MLYFKPYLIPDADDHWAFGYETGRIAKSLATGEGFSSPFHAHSGPTAWLTPVYPALLALLFKLFGVYTTSAAIAALTVNCLASALTCIPLYHITRILFGRGVGIIAGSALALYPPSIWHAINTIWDTTLFTFLAVLLIYWLLLLPERLDGKTAALTGFFMGVIVLVNPVIIAFYPFAVLWLFRRSAGTLGNRVKYLVIVFLLGLVTLLPWLLRTYAVMGRPILKSNFGLELKRGNSPLAWAATDPRAWEQIHPSISSTEFARYVQMGEDNYVKQCYHEALAFIKENPEKFLRLCLQRVYYFWFDDLGGKNEWRGSMQVSVNISLLKKLFSVLPLPFVIVGIFLARRRKVAVSLLLFFILSLPAVYYVTHVANRYRYPIEPVLLVLASYGFCSLVWRREK